MRLTSDWKKLIEDNCTSSQPDVALIEILRNISLASSSRAISMIKQIDFCCLKRGKRKENIYVPSREMISMMLKEEIEFPSA